MSKYTHAPIREIDEAIAKRRLTVKAATEIMQARVDRAGSSARKAQAWLDARTPTPTPVATAAKVSQAAAKDEAAIALRKQAWAMRQAGEGTYRECLAAIGGTPARG